MAGQRCGGRTRRVATSRRGGRLRATTRNGTTGLVVLAARRPVQLLQDSVADGQSTNLQMGVAWHDVFYFRLCAVGHDLDDVDEHGSEGVDLFKHPQPHVGRDLIVPRAASVQLASNWTDELGQATFVGGVNVFV